MAMLRRRTMSRQTADCDYLVKAILLGDVGVGKTTMMHTYTPDDGKEGLEHSRGCRRGPALMPCCRSRILTYHEKKVKVSLWDTAGQERFRSLTASYYRGVSACIIVYDVNNEESFKNVIRWHDSIKDYSDRDIVPILVGTKRADKPGLRKVFKQKAQNLASHYQMAYFEIDCHMEPKGMDFIMEMLVTLVLSKAQDNHPFCESIKPTKGLTTRLAQKGCHCHCGKGCCWF